MPFSRSKLIVAASILALLVAARLCFVQGVFRPVRIAGASMADTLRGAHCRLRCDDCGFPCRYDAERPPTEDRVVCPNCGYVNRELRGAVSQPGQRVLIDRLAYQLHPPRRWDLIAFRSQDDPDYLEVKRVVGLPGERLSIRQGNIYVDGRVARKTLPQLREVTVPVHDSRFEPRLTSGLPARWQATSGSSWTRNSGDFCCLPASARDAGPDWLVYHHWRCFASPLPRSDEYPVLDNYGYNQAESRQLHRVTDLLLVCRLRAVGGSGILRLRAADGDDWFQADLEFAERQARLYRRGQCVLTAPLPGAAYAQDVKLEFAVCDRQVLLAVDEQVMISWPYELSDQYAVIRQQAQPFGLAADGMSLEVRRLQIFRDLHYLDPQGLGRDWSAPAALGSDEVLVLGDNVPISRDSRHWEPPGLPRQLVLGPVLRIGN